MTTGQQGVDVTRELMQFPIANTIEVHVGAVLEAELVDAIGWKDGGHNASYLSREVGCPRGLLP